MNEFSRPLMLTEARDRAEREFRRYPNITQIRVNVDGVYYTFRKDSQDLTLIEAKEIK